MYQLDEFRDKYMHKYVITALNAKIISITSKSLCYIHFATIIHPQKIYGLLHYERKSVRL